MIEAVIFDLYGTLIRLDRNTRPYLRLARSIRPEDPRAVLDRSLTTDSRGVGDLAARLGYPPPEDVDLLEADLRHDMQSAEPFEDVAETLVSLRSYGLKLGLISNLATPYKEPFHRLGLAARFDATVFSCDIGLRKPDPEIYLRAACELGVDPERIVMVGDDLRSDYEGPRSVGMGAILLRRDGEAPGVASVRSLADLPAAFGSAAP